MDALENKDAIACDLKEPIRINMKNAHDYRKEFFESKTQKEKNETVLRYAIQHGFISNMDEDEREKWLEYLGKSKLEI